MSYRDENDALRARLAQAEERLREKEAELEAARERPALSGALRGFVRHSGAGGLKAIAYALLFAFVFVGGFGTALGPSCVPALGRIGAPLACPSDYDRSFTKTWTTVQGATVSEHWELRCVMQDGTEKPGNPWIAMPVLLGFFALPFVFAMAWFLAMRAKKLPKVAR